MKTFLTVAATAAMLLGTFPAAAQRRPVNPFNERLRRLPVDQQRSVLRRAVLDSGQRCKQIGSVAYQAPYKNLEMWTVGCASAGNYAVFLGLDQSVQVRPCGDLAGLRLPLCRPLPPAPPVRRRR